MAARAQSPRQSTPGHLRPLAKTRAAAPVRASYAAGDGSQERCDDEREGGAGAGILPIETTVDPEPVPESSPRALNSLSVPEDFASDFAAERAGRLPAAKAQQEAAARAQLAAHRRTDSGGSAASERLRERRGRRRLPAAQPKGGISFDRSRGGLEKKGGTSRQTQPTGRVNTSTASTVSSLATPPFPGRHAAGGMSASSDTSDGRQRDADGE